MTTSIEPFLRALVECGGSDLHCKVGSPPRVRIDGRLRKLQTRDLTSNDTEQMVNEVLREDLVDDFLRTNEADFAYSLSGVGRFRVNAFRSRGSCGLVFRRVSVGAIPLTDLGLPPVLSSLAMEPRGLVLVTGPTGSGKTTTLAGMIDHVNNQREVHIVTIEDPIEVLHYDKLSMINQREVRVDTEDFNTALRAAMRPVLTQTSIVTQRPSPSARGTSRWQMMPRSAPASESRICFCSCGGKKSMTRVMVSCASVVCRVDMTK